MTVAGWPKPATPHVSIAQGGPDQASGPSRGIAQRAGHLSPGQPEGSREYRRSSWCIGAQAGQSRSQESPGLPHRVCAVALVEGVGMEVGRRRHRPPQREHSQQREQFTGHAGAGHDASVTNLHPRQGCWQLHAAAYGQHRVRQRSPAIWFLAAHRRRRHVILRKAHTGDDP